MDTHYLPVFNGVQPRAFVVDHKTYWYRASTPEEAYYLVGFLNAPVVDGAIKAYQTRGLYGERDIHRRPFEVCAIPRFNSGDSQHQLLAALSKEAHLAVAQLDLTGTRLAGMRKKARQAAEQYIRQINAIAQRLLIQQPTPEISVEQTTGDIQQGALLQDAI
jgi:hypothetical protein